MYKRIVLFDDYLDFNAGLGTRPVSTLMINSGQFSDPRNYFSTDIHATCVPVQFQTVVTKFYLSATGGGRGFTLYCSVNKLRQARHGRFATGYVTFSPDKQTTIDQTTRYM